MRTVPWLSAMTVAALLATTAYAQPAPAPAAPAGAADSDIDPETGVSDVFRLQSGETRLNIDVGLTERAEK